MKSDGMRKESCECLRYTDGWHDAYQLGATGSMDWEG